jgi:hypothetical protein
VPYLTTDGAAMRSRRVVRVKVVDVVDAGFTNARHMAVRHF